jgi:hypothetical protein
MSFSRFTALAAVTAVPVFAACASQEDASGPATVEGTVDFRAYTGLDNPAVIAETRSGKTYIGQIQTTGAFRVAVPGGEPYHLFIANAVRTGGYRGVSDIVWGAKDSRWASLPKGMSVVNLGTIAPASGSTVAIKKDGVSGGGGGSGGGGSGGGSSSGSSSSSSPSDSADQAENESASEQCDAPGRADLPYNVRPQLGQTWKLGDAFLEKGPLPKAVLSVSMAAPAYRLAELQSGAAFTVTQADCDSAGNHGNDITWQNFDGTTESDHMTIRFCDGGGGGGGSAPSASPPPVTRDCSGEVPVCDDGGSSKNKSKCKGGSELESDDDDSTVSRPPCVPGGGDGAPPSGGTTGSVPGGSDPAPPSGGTTGSTPGGGGVGSGCVTSVDCAAGLACFSSKCVPAIN